MVDRRRPSLSVFRQCQLLDISRSGLYYQPVGVSDEDLSLMKLIDQQYMATPFYGARKIAAWLKHKGQMVNRKRVRRLMQLMGLKAIYRRSRTSLPAPGNKTYPYLLSGMEITRPNQAWAADITYIPMARGFLYLVVIMDWYSRYVLSWRLSNTLDADFCTSSPYGYVLKLSINDDPRRHPPVPRETKKRHRLYRLRGAVERVNSRVKELLGLGQITVRGIGKVTVRVILSLLVMLAAGVSMAQRQRFDEVRRLVT